MSANVLAATARESLRILLWQASWAAVLAAVFGLAFGAKAGWSALAGGGIGLIWTVYMALVLFKHSLTHGMRLSAISFLAGWMVKIVLTFSLLVVAFRSRAVESLPVLAGLFGAMVAYWTWFALGKKYAGDPDGK